MLDYVRLIGKSHEHSVNVYTLAVVIAVSFFGFLAARDQNYTLCFLSLVLVLCVIATWVFEGNPRTRESLIYRSEQFLGVGHNDGTIVTERIALRDRPHLQLAIETFRQKFTDLPEPYGVLFEGLLLDSMFQTVFRNSRRSSKLQWTYVPKSLTEEVPCVDNGVYFLRTEKKTPFLLLVMYARFDVLACTDVEAREAMQAIKSEMAKHNVYRGQVISLDPADPTREVEQDYMIRFHDMPAVQREQIILPEEMLSVIERNVIGMLANAERLRQAERNTRQGLLFHGPPGVGKTMVTKYLSRACPNYTVIVLTGRQLGLIRESCRMARQLAPALVVIEDIDLIALDRQNNGNNPLLHDLMDEMDGIGPKADVIFLMTTNRAEALEPALASRPGRVDQAILFSLPDEDCRRRLFQRFGIGLDIREVNIESLVQKTDGASPAFIQELFRKAAVIAVERNDDSKPLKVTSADFDKAIYEMVESGGDLTRNLLGFRKKVGF